jgi:colicin import membrane protein
MTEKQIGIIGTSVFHLVIMLILLFFLIYTPIPVSSGGGILIDFGNTEMAGGEFEPDMSEQQPAAAQQPEAESENEEEIATQDFEEAPAVANKPEKKTEVKKTVTKPAETKSKDTEKPKETKPQVNTKALYSGKGEATKNEDKSQGIYKGSGNQGAPDGKPGGGNEGNGSGTGSGAGLGIKIGGGLENRKVLSLPKPEFKVQQDGIVVVEVTVNRDGKVIGARPGVTGTNTNDQVLFNAARKAALESKFDVKSGDQSFQTQTGTITYHFKLD